MTCSDKNSLLTNHNSQSKSENKTQFSIFFIRFKHKENQKKGGKMGSRDKCDNNI